MSQHRSRTYTEPEPTDKRWIPGDYSKVHPYASLPIGTIIHSSRKAAMTTQDQNEWRKYIEWVNMNIENKKIEIEKKRNQERAETYQYPNRPWISSEHLSFASTGQLSMGTIIRNDGKAYMNASHDEWLDWKNWYDHQPLIVKQRLEQTIISLKYIIERRTIELHQRMIEDAEFLFKEQTKQIKKKQNEIRALKSKQTKEINIKIEKSRKSEIEKKEKELKKLQNDSRDQRARLRLLKQ